MHQTLVEVKDIKGTHKLYKILLIVFFSLVLSLPVRDKEQAHVNIWLVSRHEPLCSPPTHTGAAL